MLDLNQIKFTTEDNKEYIILTNKLINGNFYAYAVNLNNEIDSMYVKIINNQNGISFETINDQNIINELSQSIDE